ncbi:MAG TPA: AMP-binding protein, partial [Actinomycetes bacterium]
MTASELPERYNVSTLLDANLGAGRGPKAAIVGEYGVVSYERLLAMACAAGRALGALGVQREQRVLMVMDDTPAFPAVFLGAIRAGMVPVPLNPLFKPEDYRYLLSDSEARAVVVDADLLGKVVEALAGHEEPVRLVVANGTAVGAPGDALVLEDLLAEHAGELAPAPTHRDDAAFWLYSSGSTGR